MEGTVRLGFLGFGNMAQAMAKGLLSAGAVPDESIFVCARHWDKLERNARKMGVIPCKTASEVVQRSNIVIAAVKPYLMEEVLSPLLDALRGKVLLTVASGWGFERLEALTGPGIHHLSLMPNTPVAVHEGVVLLEERHTLTETEFAKVQALMAALGTAVTLPTEQMSIAGSISGCGPAFAAMFIEALGDAGVHYGLPRATAYTLAAQMLAGTGKLQLETGDHPGTMKDAVCSPGGTTIAGVEALEKNGFRAAVIEAIHATMDRK